MRSWLAPLAAALPLLALACDARGTLELTVVDRATGRSTPARLALADGAGNAVVPDDAVPVAGDCGSLPAHNWVPAIAQLQAARNPGRSVRNPFTDTTEFYSDGRNSLRLEPGRYAVTATKGIEYERATAEALVEAGRTTRIEVELERWIDLPSQGWYSADDHLHIARPHRRTDPRIATWMRAEDLHVANLLQMGLARDVHITPQRSFGEPSVYRDGDTLVASGQENPRTHLLGHSIVLGAPRWLDEPSEYLLYDQIWRESRALGGANGYAHWGLAGAEEGLAVWGPEGLIDFLEVLGFGLPFYERWYESLDLGLRPALTAGTDYPCSPSLPGRERFYTRLSGPLDYDSWLAAVRAGRTFVTNGPIVDLRIDGAAAGDELRLDEPAALTVRGRVRFDPSRDQIATLELLRGGEVVERIDTTARPGELRFERTIDVERSTWFALRATGRKRDETPLDAARLVAGMLVLERESNDALLESMPSGPTPRIATAHTGAIFVTVEGSVPLAGQSAAAETARLWLARLDELEARLDDDRIAELAGFPGRGDGVEEAVLRTNRAALLEAIEAARRRLGG